MKSKRRRFGQILIFAVLLTVLAFVSGGCAAATYTVCPDGSCNYTSIPAAIDASQPGDAIIVRDGSDYTGSDTNGDGFGDTLLPYNSSGNIVNGGDWLPLVAAPFSLDLVTGLNLISLPINDASVTNAASLAAKLGSNCTEVVKFNATEQQLQSYVPGVPLNNFAIVGAEGYFVNLNQPTSVVLTGTGWPSPFSIELVQGLNLIGMPVNDSAVTTASTLAAKIGSNCREVVNWERGTQSYVSYVTGVPLNDFAIRAGDGYFVTVTDQTEVTFEGDPWGNSAGLLVQPNDLTYLGAFRLPGGDTPPQTFAYGGNAMTFNPDGDSTNTDQYPGSLFVMGHDRQAWGSLPDGNQVAELTIPVPVNSGNLEDLPYATFIQSFHDVATGYFHDLDEIPKVGMQYLNHSDTGPKIHLCWGRHLQQLEDNIASHAWVGATLATPDLKGVWYIGNQNPNSINGYMFDIPAAWADAHAQGRYLATGRVHGGGLGGMGPALFAYRPWLAGGAAPANGTHLAETTLLLYENAFNSEEITRCMTGYQHPDEWEGGAWITTSSGKSAVLFAGTKSTGTKYWYGYLNPAGPQYPCVDTEVTDFVTCRMADGTPCPPEDFAGCCDGDSGTCISYRGWWSTRFDAQLILYDPADLARVAAGTMNSWEPQPYATIDIDEHLYFNPPEWDEIILGTGDQRRYRIGDATYDREHGILYVLELYADGARPVVHVWRVQ